MAWTDVVRAASLALVAVLGWTTSGLAEVGFQTVVVRLQGAAPIPVAIWYPTTASEADRPLGLFNQHVAEDAPVSGEGRKLIVISHGNGGTKDGHYDTALALAQAGFIVAALEHTGDNYRDQSRAIDVANRPRELHLLIDYMMTEWPRRAALDQHSVGAFGFSSGGFSVLVAAGGEPDLSLMASHCATRPTLFDCALIAAHGSPPPVSSQPFTHDERIRALVVAAPALGFTFAHGLTSVIQPIQLWKAGDDHILPAPEYADAVRLALRSAPDFRVVDGADHWDFLAPCSDALAKAAPVICHSAPGFDRVTFHQSFNRAVVGFFRDHLP